MRQCISQKFAEIETEIVEIAIAIGRETERERTNACATPSPPGEGAVSAAQPGRLYANATAEAPVRRIAAHGSCRSRTTRPPSHCPRQLQPPNRPAAEQQPTAAATAEPPNRQVAAWQPRDGRNYQVAARHAHDGINRGNPPKTI